MNRIQRVVALCGLLVSAALSAADSDIFSLPYQMKDLPNGLRVIALRTDYPDVVSLQIPVQTGSRNEVEPGKSGFAHFFEHMMFRGTDNYSQEEYGDILKRAGADQNAYTTDDYTNYYINFTREDLETMLKLEADRFKNLNFSESDFRTEALAVKGEYLKNYSNPIQKMFERIRDLAFDEHTYKHTTMGFLADIEVMPDQFDYGRTFFDRWYRPENSAVIVVGDIDVDETMALVEKYFGDWEPGDFSVEIPVEPEPTGARYDHVKWDAPTQPWVLIAWHGPAANPDETDYAALSVAGQLFLGQTSDAYKKIVNTDRTADQFFYYLPPRRDPQLFYIGARLTDIANAESVINDVMTAVTRMRTEMVDAKRVEDTKSALRYGFAGGLDNSSDIASTMAQFVQYERTPETINEYYQRFEELSSEDLRNAANRYLTDDRRVALTLSNDDDMAASTAIVDLDERVAAQLSRVGADVPVVALPGQSDLINISLLFQVGPALDPPGKKGLAQLTASMLTDGGSSSMTIDEINKAFYPLAAGFNSQVDKEMTRLAGSVHRDNLDEWYAVVRQMVLEPGWREDDFERLKTQQINAISTNLKGNNDEELSKEVLYEALYGEEHPYGALNLGAESDVAELTLDDVKAFYAEHFNQANLVVGLAGGYDNDFQQRLLRDLSALPQGEKSVAEIPPAPDFDGRHAMIVEKETPAVGVSFGFPIDLRRGDPDWVALWLARSWLGEHRSSNSYLYQRIRETRGMNYGDYAYIEYYPRGMFRSQPNANLGRQQQVFQVWLRPLRDNNDAHFATRVAMYELQKLIDNGLTEEAFEATRDFLDKYVAQMTDGQFRQLGYAIDSEYYGTDRFADYVREGLAELSSDQVNAAIRRHLQTDNMQLVFIAKDAADLQTRLSTDQESPMVYNTEKDDPELLAEDEIIKGLQLDLDSVKTVPLEQVFD